MCILYIYINFGPYWCKFPYFRPLHATYDKKVWIDATKKYFTSSDKNLTHYSAILSDISFGGIYGISGEPVWSPQRCWTRTLLGGLWNMHNCWETCTTSLKHAQHLWNVRIYVCVYIYICSYIVPFYRTFFLANTLIFYLTFFLAYTLTFYLAYFLHIFWHSFWHSISHSIWHLFWHSFWHLFWHLFWHSI